MQNFETAYRFHSILKSTSPELLATYLQLIASFNRNEIDLETASIKSDELFANVSQELRTAYDAAYDAIITDHTDQPEPLEEVNVKEEQQAEASSKSERPPEFNDAIVFLQSIKAASSDTYTAFLELLAQYTREKTAVAQVIREAEVLFADRPELMQGFMRFMPREIKSKTEGIVDGEKKEELLLPEKDEINRDVEAKFLVEALAGAQVVKPEVTETWRSWMWQMVPFGSN
ncbi:hypothetical protein BJ508DRAFT_328161 [Ascobolus immersus RN42]|uniref:Uncharacterized protein n=1 Tax=Ascobolus immersus RN42 TaxID=1160509 RepID=A0A3N4I0F8_ASCIM|nr:hypothetical protein BJ508DRAFT_328161 [Ascobolus immersus RN42]